LKFVLRRHGEEALRGVSPLPHGKCNQKKENNKVNTALTWLNLEYNPIRDEGMAALAEALRVNTAAAVFLLGELVC